MKADELIAAYEFRGGAFRGTTLTLFPGRLAHEGVDVVDFSAGAPDFPTPDNIKNAAIDALHKTFTKYTPGSGTVELKQTICDYHKRSYGTAYSPKECIATIGGKHAIFNLVQALIDPGDEVIIPVPYWVTYKDVVNFAELEHRHRRGSQWLGFADCRAADADPSLPRLTRQEGDGDIDLRGIDSSEQRCELAVLGETGACLRHRGTCLDQLVKKHRGPVRIISGPARMRRWPYYRVSP